MKFIFLAGGVLGFAVAATTGWLSEQQPERILLDASLGCIAGALMFRWFWSVVLHGMRDVYLARQRAALMPPKPDKAKS